MKRPCSHTAAFVPFILTLTFLLNVDALFCQYYEIETDSTPSRPIVNNGRVLITSISSIGTVLNPMSALELYDSRTNARTQITFEAEMTFAGWPDLDADGNVAYVRRGGGTSLVMYYDGTTHTQISDNPMIPGSPTLGLAKDKVKVGHVVTAGGYVIFRDSDGNIFAYGHSHAAKGVQRITRDATQSVNIDDEHMSDPRFAMVRQYRFDGKTLFWMHQKIIKDGEEAEITVFKAEAPFTEAPEEIASFRAWVPSPNSLIARQYAAPFLVASGSEAAWQYFPPGEVAPVAFGLPVSLQQGYIGYYDGTKAATVYGPGPIRVQSIRLASGRLIWPTGRDEHTRKDHVMQYQSGKVSIVLEHSDPPTDGIGEQRYWDRIGKVEFDGGNVLYSMNEVECKSMPIGDGRTVCKYLPTGRYGLFIDGVTLPVHTIEQETGCRGGLAFDEGLSAFILRTVSNCYVGTYRVRVAPDVDYSLEALGE